MMRLHKIISKLFKNRNQIIKMKLNNKSWIFQNNFKKLKVNNMINQSKKQNTIKIKHQFNSFIIHKINRIYLIMRLKLKMILKSNHKLMNMQKLQFCKKMINMLMNPNFQFNKMQIKYDVNYNVDIQNNQENNVEIQLEQNEDVYTNPEKETALSSEVQTNEIQQQDTEAQDIQVKLENEYNSEIQAETNDDQEAEQNENYIDEVPQVQQDDIQQTQIASAEQDQQEILAQGDSIQFYDSPSNQNLVNQEIKLIPNEESNNAEAQVVEEQQIVVENQTQELADENNSSETQSNNNADPNDVNFDNNNEALVNDGNDCVIIYNQCYFKGESMKTCKDLSQMKDFYFEIRSLQLPSGTTLTIFDHPNFEGQKHVFSQSEQCLTDSVFFA